jgi:hypothetical protein
MKDRGTVLVSFVNDIYNSIDIKKVSGKNPETFFSGGEGGT